MNIFPKRKEIRPLSRPSFLWLCYGLYTVLCQLSLILLHTLTYAENVSGALLAPRFAPMVEHSLMSLAILAVGTYLIERTLLEIKGIL